MPTKKPPTPDATGKRAKPKGTRSPRASARGSAQPALPPALVGRITQGDRSAANAILLAAGELFTTGGPSQVSLRDVAERAGVNYGLIHHYFGTKEALLAALFQHFTAYGRTFIDRSTDAASATRELFEADSGNFAEMLAWMVLDGADPHNVFGDTSSLEAYAGMIEKHRRDHGKGGGRFDPRLVAGFLMLNIMIWDLYAPYIQVLSALEDRELPDLRAEVLDLMQHIVTDLGTDQVAPPASE